MSTTVKPVPRRIKRILIATDFSDGAAGAIDLGLAIAARHDAQIQLVHAISSDVRGSLPLEFQEAASRRMETLEREVSAAGRPVIGCCRGGRPWQVITDLALELESDLILIGKRGHTAYTRLLLGSTTDRVVRAATMPVLTVGPDTRAVTTRFTTILAPTDFSAGATEAIRAAVSLLRPGDPTSRLILLHAWHPIVDVYGLGTQATVLHEPFGETESELRSLLEKQASELTDHELQVETVVAEGYPAHVIEQAALEHDVDLIAIGTHGHGVVQHLLMGSVAERVLHHAACPVLTVRQPNERRSMAGSTATAAAAPGSAPPSP